MIKTFKSTCSMVCFSAFLLSCLLFASTAQARSITPLEGLEALRKGFAGVADFTAEITQEKQLSIMKRSLLSSGVVRFRKPDLFMMEIKPPHATRMLLRDSIIEQATGKTGERNRIVLPPEQSLKQWSAKLATPVRTLPEGVTIRADLTGSTYTLSIAPRTRGQVRELTIVFLEDGTIKRLVIDEHNGDRATMTFRKVRRNIGLTDRDFQLD